MLSHLHCHGLKFSLQISVFGWLVSAAAVARPSRPLLLPPLPSFPISAFNPVPPSFHLASLPGRLPISNIEMIRSCFVISKDQTAPSLLVTHILFPLFGCLILLHF